MEIEKNDKPDVERIITNISDVIIKASPIPQTIQTISDSVLSFEQNKSDNLEIIGKQFETDSAGKPTLEGMKKLSKAMEIYSDKHYETARYLFVKDGVIIRHKTVTAQIPGKLKTFFLIIRTILLKCLISVMEIFSMTYAALSSVNVVHELQYEVQCS